MSLRWKLALIALLATALGFWLLTASLVDRLRPHYQLAMEESLVDTATLLAAVAAAELETSGLPLDAFVTVAPSPEDLRTALTRAGRSGHVAIAVTDAQGVVLFDSAASDSQGEDRSQRPEIADALARRSSLPGGSATRSEPVVPGDTKVTRLTVATPIIVRGRVAGAVTVTRLVDAGTPFVKEARHSYIAAGLIAAGATALLVLLAGHLVTAPLRALIAHVQAVKSGQRPPLPPLGRSEIGQLGRAFHDLAAELDGRAYVERYVQHLTHELKAPLSAIRGASELLAEDLPPAERLRFLANLRAESARMQALIDTLLHLAALERREEPLARTTLDTDTLLADVAESLRPAAAARGVTIAIAAPADLAVSAEAFLLRQALSNLVLNAVEFAASGTVVEVAAARRDGVVVFTVADRGPGIPDYAKGRIFERFFSLPRPDTGRKGSGLGLSLVQEVARRHGGSVALGDREGGGTVAELVVPG